jgi:hypothetical protein
MKNGGCSMPISKETNFLSSSAAVAAAATFALASAHNTANANEGPDFVPSKSPVETNFLYKNIGKHVLSWNKNPIGPKILSISLEPQTVTKYHVKATHSGSTQKHATQYSINHPKMPAELRRIAGCESGYNSPTSQPRWHIDNFEGSDASGGFQIEDGTWADFHNYARAKDADPEVQVEKAELLIKEDGTAPWDSSEYCWG